MIRKEGYVLEIEKELKAELETLRTEITNIKKDMLVLVEGITSDYYIFNDSYGKAELTFEKDTKDEAKKIMNNLNNIIKRY